MAQHRLELLQLLREQELRRRDDAQAAVRAARQQLETQRRQAASLTGYRVDYSRKWAAQFERGVRMEILQAYHGFLARLDEAIAQQQAVVAHAQRNADAAQQRLVARELRLATVDRLIERQHEAQALVERRQEQKATDEQASRSRRAPALGGMA